MNYAEIFIISFVIALSGALAPGPLLTAVIYESSRYGAKSGPFIILGHAIAEIVIVILIVVGATRFINNPVFFNIIYIIGAGVLFYFGLKILFSLNKITFASISTPQLKSSHLALQGITLSVINPYWSIWWLTIGLGLILSAEKQGLTGLFFFFSGHIMADLGWYSLVSWSTAKSKKIMSLRIYKSILGACGVFLLGFGIYFLKSAVENIRFP